MNNDTIDSVQGKEMQPEKKTDKQIKNGKV